MKPALYLLAAALLCTAIPPAAQAQNRITIRPSKAEKTIVSIDPLFEKGKLWAYTPTTLETTWKEKGFKWLSATAKDSGQLRRERFGLEPLELQAFSQSQTVEEVNFQFKDAKLNEVIIAIWNKGDSESESKLSENDFKKKVAAWNTELTSRLGARPEALGKDIASAAKADRFRYAGAETLAVLEYSGGKEKITDPYTGKEKTGVNFQGEFIRLRLMPKPVSLVGVNTTTGGVAKVARDDLARKLTKDTNGDVYIAGVPMVDQGDKGYCAVATAARVLNYYGIPADQHEMAQVANTDGGGGTNPAEMETALKKLQGKYHVRFLQQIDTDYSTEGAYKRFLANYNRAAKKMEKRVLDDNFFYFNSGLDKDVLREVRGKGPIFDKFMKAVKDNIDKGVPLLWGLQLGKYPEEGKEAEQGGGGHMRLIIGYNMAKQQIIFSDSWGAGHEKKRMAAPDASAATMGVYTITPAI